MNWKSAEMQDCIQLKDSYTTTQQRKQLFYDYFYWLILYVYIYNIHIGAIDHREDEVDR